MRGVPAWSLISGRVTLTKNARRGYLPNTTWMRCKRRTPGVRDRASCHATRLQLILFLSDDRGQVENTFGVAVGEHCHFLTTQNLRDAV
jgi:hypothetical protein